MDKEQYDAQMRALDVAERRARLQYIQPIGPSGLSTAAMIFGILPTPMLGILLGIVATATAKNSESSGRGAVGIIGGVIWLLIAIAVQS